MPNFGEMYQTALTARSSERIANARAEGQVANAAIRGGTQMRLAEMSKKYGEQTANAKKSGRRMAGIVGGLGTLAVGGMMALQPKDKELERPDYSGILDSYNSQIQRAESQIGSLQQQIEDLGSTPLPEYQPVPYSQTSPSSSTATPSVSSQPITPGDNGMISQAQAKQLLLNQGMDDHNATIGAAVMMGESRGNPGALNDKGEYSLGLWQHNRDTGEDRRKFYGIKDWSELANPEVNARATYRLWERAGKTWKDWSAYTNGSYKSFL
jgi:hypothetical protein